MDEDFEFEAEGRPFPSARFKKIDLLVVGLAVLQQAIQAVADGIDTLVELTAMHANYQVDQRQFAQEAALEIETLVSETVEEE